ncbi:MAG: squalene/phytoene synthase family protein [Magnetovibrio sp.]|nr:squalene/phytoene synthase family protein [Magnetovibrio sp.]
MFESNATVFDLSRLDRERYLCALSAPHSKRGGLMALIAFNIELSAIAKTVSEPMLGKIKLQWWIDVVPGILAGRPPSHPVAQGLAQVRDVLQGRLSELRGLSEARNFDLEPDRPNSLLELTAYSQATGGVLQGLMVDVLGVEDEAARRAAIDVGTAWALIGLMRALPFQNGQRRDMLPQGTKIRDVLTQAGSLLQNARSCSPTKAALPALVIARLADRHLKRLERQGWNPAAREEPPAGVGAVASIWLGKLTGRF